MSDPGRWREIDRLFAEALDRRVSERAAFLDEACGGDAALRAEVEALLAADESSGGFLDQPVGELLELSLETGTGEGRLGPYRLLRRIGGGGMGTVYHARREDEQYERDVAIKILRSGLESTQALHRFLEERQILARLDHPGIARLYDGGGTRDGRPYLVMELVDGLPLTEHCDRHRLTIDQRLELFRRICSAVQYAHQNLLVHRDLKPSNILVTAEGEPKLLDFGIAKRLHPAASGFDETHAGLRVLTPSYASPEQVKGDAITTASDVYSLGVILYELLAGRSPYRLDARLRRESGLERAICEAEPERPSAALFRGEPPAAEEIAAARCARPRALARRLRGDLDNIVLMALRKEPERRYGSAAQLSRDLESHLQHLPVVARPESLPVLAGKLVRRHRAAAFAAAVMVLVIAASVTSLLAQGRRAARERDKARYSLGFLVETFKEADPQQARGDRLTAREVLAQGSERASRDLAGEPDAQAELMDAIGQVELGLGAIDRAGPLLERSLALRRRVHGPGSLEVAESLEHLGAFERERSNLEAAEKRLREALEIRRGRQGEGAVEVADTLNLLGQVLVARAEYPRAEAAHREALAIARRSEGPVGAAVARSILYLAQAKSGAGDYAEAEKLFRQGLEVERQALGEDDPAFYRDQTTLGEILIGAGKYKEAEALLRAALPKQRQLIGRDHPDVVVTLTNLGTALHYQGRYVEEEALNREALAIVRARYGPSHWLLDGVLINLANALEGQARGKEAIPYYEEVLDIRRRTVGEEHPSVAQVLLLIAGIHRMNEEHEECRRLAGQALAIFEASEGRDHPHTAYALREIGRSYVMQKRFAEAEPYLRRSLEIRRKELAADHPELAKAKISMAHCLVGLGRPDEAAVLEREARATMAAHFPPGSEIFQGLDKLRAKIEEARKARG
ncbi:MAG: tetratricopeptide repeat protein [Thermoanaerobaculia bacterium]